jgi:hypothetical protein
LCNDAQLRECNADGTPKNTPCNDGCLNGVCRTDGTVGRSGWVTCGTDNKRCTTAQGCYNDPSNPGPGICAGGEYLEIKCDGPNDCAQGQVCCKQSQYIESHYLCFNGGACPNDYDRTYFAQVCDPKLPVCPAGYSCSLSSGPPYLCLAN